MFLPIPPNISATKPLFVTHLPPTETPNENSVIFFSVLLLIDPS